MTTEEKTSYSSSMGRFVINYGEGNTATYDGVRWRTDHSFYTNRLNLLTKIENAASVYHPNPNRKIAEMGAEYLDGEVVEEPPRPETVPGRVY